jgi:ABC-type multidrug transport system fused ATPase/permease subunit
MALPDGYETALGMGGRELSRGQAQRVNVARALLRNPGLLLLDEATASLDSVAESQVQRSIDRLMVGRTCFIVAHRLSTLRGADRLIVLEHGRCIGFGSHEELMRDCGLYRQFWELQRLGHDDLDDIASMLSTLPSPENQRADPKSYSTIE